MLSGAGHVAISTGDLWVIASSVFWALHVLLVGPRGRPLCCAVPGCCRAVRGLRPGVAGLGAADRDDHAGRRWLATVPILYTGILSVGFAYTGQVVGQRYADAADAAIILSAETLFAAMFGFLLMGDRLNVVGIAGCVLIFACILAVQMMPMIRSATDRRTQRLIRPCRTCARKACARSWSGLVKRLAAWCLPEWRLRRRR